MDAAHWLPLYQALRRWPRAENRATIGTVNADREPVVRIRLHDVNGQEQVAIVETGFTGELTFPPDFIVALGLPWTELSTAILADGSQVLCDVYEATVVWDGQVIAISVDEANSEPLIGMALMDGFHIHIKDVDGGLVQIERI